MIKKGVNLEASTTTIPTEMQKLEEHNGFKTNDQITYLGFPARIKAIYLHSGIKDQVFYTVSYNNGNGPTTASHVAESTITK